MNESRPIDVYLSDHLAGATGGCELAQRAAEDHSGTPLGEFFSNLATEIEQDKNTLEDLMKRLGAQPNPLKQAGAWVMEKVTRLKLSTQTGGAPQFNALLMLETLEMGVTGKLCLWRALKEISEASEALGSFDLDNLESRAQSQVDSLEKERLKAAGAALAEPAS